MTENTTDEQITAQVIRAPEMFGFLIDRYQDKLDRYIYRQTGLDIDSRQDILQDVFIKAYQNINSFNPDMSFNSWIYRICHNTLINDWKKNKPYREGVSFDSESGDFLQQLFSQSDTANLALEAESRRHVETGLSLLSEKYRSILMLRFFEDMSYEEISDVLQIPSGTVATHISRAKKLLEKHIEPLLSS